MRTSIYKIKSIIGIDKYNKRRNSMVDKYVCVDFDGTLLKFNWSLRDRLLEDRKIDLDVVNTKSYTYKGFGEDLQKLIFDEIKNNVKIYENLEFFDGAKESLKKLQSKFKTKAYTGISAKEEIYNTRLMLIKELGMNELPFTLNKPTDLGAYALIDDCDAVHRQWIKDGYTGKLFLIDSPYNRKLDKETEDRVIRVRDFNEAVEILLNMEEN